MGLDRVVYTPKVEIDQDRYEELIRNELKYEQYKTRASEDLKNIIENIDIENMIESEEINNE